ncbi:hypothetical protein G9C98_003685 [Cotesia typhae]|uniref:limulus clotting factor C n=2 Tax=Cotesia typhae TaxID=2053667 RepID=A0A8J5V873_9HYME|nr:hypothetical protein G9C98_003685 [Cotesia typhae]
MYRKLICMWNYLLIFLLMKKSSAQNSARNSCFTSDYQIGECINILGCPDALNLLQIQVKTPEIIRTLRNSQCGIEGRYPKVCCVLKNQLWTPKKSNIISTTKSYNPDSNTPSFRRPSDPLLPSDCGRDLSVRIIGGERANIDEFPWITLLEYDHPDGRKSALCSGMLISKRYILSAAHCVNTEDLNSWRPERVIFGEYDRRTNPDCISDGYNSQICAPLIVKIDIEEIIQHENYKSVSLSRDRTNDIALIRLSSPVEFTDYIKPICLPHNGNIPQKLWVAGWGATENGSRSDVKLKLAISPFDHEECQARYGRSSISIQNNQICAGGQLRKDSCRGDSGGPLMSVERAADGTGKWTAVGVVSFGPDNCGLPGWPGVYTKIDNYIDWIMRRLRPEPRAHYWK